MSAVFQFILKHGYSFFFAVLFAHQLGLPVPGPPFLLAAGALAARGKLRVLTTMALAIIACVTADSIWYEASRRRGERVLHLLHKFTRDPEYHDRRSKEVFARWGLLILLVAKFVPGLDAVAPPLAGISRTNRIRFLLLDASGAALYAMVYGGLGYMFSNDLDRAAGYVSRTGTMLAVIGLLGLCVYIAHGVIQRQRSLGESPVVRIAPVDSIGQEEPDVMPCVILGEEKNAE